MIIPSSNLLGFPLDSSQIGYHDDGLPAYSQEYTSSDYRIVLDKLISTGVIADEDSQSLKPSIASGQTSKTAKVRIKTGAAVIVGGFAINKSDTDINIVAPEIQGSETSRTKTTYIYIQKFEVSQNAQIVGEEFNFVSEESTSSGNSILEAPPSKNYALCLARVVSRTTKSGTSYLYQHTVTDLRASEYCGWAAPFVDVDTSAYYDAVQQVVEESKAEVEATIPTLLENAQDSVDSAIAELEEQTQTAVDLAQSAIEGTVAGELDSRLDSIEKGVPAFLSTDSDAFLPPNKKLIKTTNPGSYSIAEDVFSTIDDMPEGLEPCFCRLYVMETDVGSHGINNVIQILFAKSERGGLDNKEYSAIFCRTIKDITQSSSTVSPWVRNDNTCVATLYGGFGLKNIDLNGVFSVGSHYINKEDFGTIQNMPNGLSAQFARLYVFYMGVSEYTYMGDEFDNHLQVLKTASGETYSRKVVGRSGTKIPSQNTEWKKVILGKVQSSDLADGSVTEDKLADESVTPTKIETLHSVKVASDLFLIPTTESEYIEFYPDVQYTKSGRIVFMSFALKRLKDIPSGQVISLNRKEALPKPVGFGIVSSNIELSGTMYDWGIQLIAQHQVSRDFRLNIAYVSE